MIKDIEKKMPPALAEWGPILFIWNFVQVALPKVIRWKHYLLGPRTFRGRKQNSAQHVLSITKLVDYFEESLGPSTVLDWSFLKSAVLVHDDGEAFLGYDTLYAEKSVDQDLKEYKAFEKYYSGLNPRIFQRLQRAFLVQFALDNPEIFPADAREVMKKIATEHALLCHCFDAIERWDYIMYAVEQYIERKNDKILVQVLRHQVPQFERLAKVEGLYFREIYTDEIRDYFNQFIADRKGKWIEKVKEKPQFTAAAF